MLERGDVAVSLAGRDKGSLLAVTERLADGVLVCDGKARPLHNPKRKNLRHVRALGVRLSEAQLLSDRALRKALAILKGDLK